MKICVITATLNHGGASIAALDIAKGMSEKGHEVVFITSGDAYSVFKKDLYTVRVLKRIWKNPAFHYFNPQLIWELFRLLKNIKPDIIHIHNINLQTFSLGSLLFSRKYPTVWTLHDLWPVCLTGWPDPPDCPGLLRQCKNCPRWPSFIVFLNRVIKRYAFKIANVKFASPSKWMAERLESSGIIFSPIEIIHNGIDPSSFNLHEEKQNISEIQLSKEKTILLFIGGKKLAGELPAVRKGWEYLLSALQILSLKRKDIHLLYIGDKVSFPNNFPFTYTLVDGVSREDMKKYYKLSDVFVLPTLGDNSPLTILEAMNCRVPVIASAVGGIPEIVIQGKTGILCKPRDAESLANSIELLLSDQYLKEEVVEQAYELIQSDFSFVQMIDKYESLYNNIINKYKET